MKSTITFTATVVFDKGGHITVQAEDVPIAGADLFDLVENMFEQVPPGIVAAIGMGSTSLVPREGAPPRPPVAPIDAPDAKPEKVPEARKAAPKSAKDNPGRRLPGNAAPGTCAHTLLTAVADAGGTFTGSLSDLATNHGTGNRASSVAMASQLNRTGLVDAVPRIGPVKLTPAGWAAIGRTPTAAAPKASTPSPLAAVPDPPTIPDLGPIEKRPFDPDRVRQQQANAL